MSRSSIRTDSKEIFASLICGWGGVVQCPCRFRALACHIVVSYISSGLWNSAPSSCFVFSSLLSFVFERLWPARLMWKVPVIAEAKLRRECVCELPRLLPYLKAFHQNFMEAQSGSFIICLKSFYARATTSPFLRAGIHKPAAVLLHHVNPHFV